VPPRVSNGSAIDDVDAAACSGLSMLLQSLQLVVKSSVFAFASASAVSFPSSELATDVVVASADAGDGGAGAGAANDNREPKRTHTLKRRKTHELKIIEDK
jgi:hypothetical protein